MIDYTPIIGLEIHVELKTRSKMFCGCKNDPFHAPNPNIYTCPVCLGLPGGLPVPNKKAIEWTIMLGLALGSEIPEFSKFDRKNYFYPDLAKGYQISQYDQPFCVGGKVETSYGDVRLRRVHLEEDTGKLQHVKIEAKPVTLVDFNRSGVPLVEIVTEPDIRSGDHAKEFLKKLRQIVVDLGISDAEMEKGSMRLEPNISVVTRPAKDIKQKNGYIDEAELPKYKVEVKNINSFSFVKKAIEYEVDRHRDILSGGNLPVQETRGWSEDKAVTVSQRRKEDADDYRYFPEPDIPPLRFAKEFIESLRTSLPELPDARVGRFMAAGVSEQNAKLATETRERTELLDAAITLTQKNKLPFSLKQLCDLVINKKVDENGLTAEALVSAAQNLLTVESIPDAAILEAIGVVKKANEQAVTDFKNGKEQVLMFLLGMTIKQLAGKGDKAKILDLLKSELSS